MLERVRKLIETPHDRKSFFVIIEKHFPVGGADYRLVTKAYETAKNAFRGHVRENNEERYFEHLRGVALIVMEHLRVNDAEVIVAALLHDVVEDIDGWTTERIALEFGQKVSEIVWWVTKPSVSDFNGDKEARNRHYHENLRRAPRSALVVKLADRLHNCLDLWDMPKAKQSRKVRETQDFYIPLAVQEILLIHELEEALSDAMKKGTDK